MNFKYIPILPILVDLMATSLITAKCALILNVWNDKILNKIILRNQIILVAPPSCFSHIRQFACTCFAEEGICTRLVVDGLTYNPFKVFWAQLFKTNDVVS